jgi:hypothetical protein
VLPWFSVVEPGVFLEERTSPSNLRFKNASTPQAGMREQETRAACDYSMFFEN